jgi:hypothetical protein
LLAGCCLGTAFGFDGFFGLFAIVRPSLRAGNNTRCDVEIATCGL